jgi:hypothetical protein
MAIEIIPKAQVKKPLAINYLYYFALALLISSFFIWFILNQMIKSSNVALEKIEKSLADEKATKKALEDEVLNYKDKINDFSFIFSSHKMNTKFFNFLESITHPKVFFSDFTFNPAKGKVSFSGKTDSFESLGQQILILKEQKNIKELVLSKVGLGKEGGIEFSIDFSFDPEVVAFEIPPSPEE